MDHEPDTFYRGKLNLSLKFVPSEEVGGKYKGKTKGALHILIKQAEELPIMDSNGLTDATVKCYLLPHRSSSGKRKTKVIKNNLNPVWEEEFVYNYVTLEDLTSGRVLEVTVWDYDRRGSNDFIGGLRLGPTPGRAAKEWMDSIGDEVSHWEAMLTCPGKWVEQWHTLRATMEPLGAFSATKPPVKVGRAQELSPVEEASPTKEMSPADDQLKALPTSSSVSSISEPIVPSVPTVVVTEDDSRGNTASEKDSGKVQNT